MHCHMCENSAIGVCRHCYKFYCSTHGDGFCEVCQKKGWATGEKQPPVAVATPAIATLTRETASTTATAKVAIEAKEEEKPVAAGST